MVISDAAGLADFVNVITGAVLKTAADALGLRDVASLDKTVIASDVVSVVE